MLRVAISGTHQVGKTTLIDAVRAEVQVVGGVMRAVAAAGFGVAAETTPATIEAYLTRQLESERQADGAGQPVLSDRVLVDGLAYVEAARDFGLATYPWTDAEIMLLRTSAQAHAASYDVHCFLPVEFPSRSELSFHAGGEEFRMAVSEHLEAQLNNKWPIPVIRLTGSVEDRATALRRVLNRTHGPGW